MSKRLQGKRALINIKEPLFNVALHCRLEERMKVHYRRAWHLQADAWARTSGKSNKKMRDHALRQRLRINGPC
ncbi:hypothetical protein [Pandoraea sp. SD6-2]|uniref:hypothetical protein n=1 Tax=Pandoraea sp. SD6-2 TaxID=1286093 RepID=UPI0003A9E442|nr:hypothetical protein [Pandoraea sp. SD6-2]